jgi:hypothetical protein
MLGFLGSEPRLVMSKVRLAARRRPGEAETPDGNTGRAPSFGLHSCTRLATEEKITEEV